jgi:nifR3 family TIM-barrel protein
MKQKPLHIAQIKLKNRLFLAPMVDVTDAAYRQICREAGAGISYIEMLNIGAILHSNKKTQTLMKTYPGEYPKAIQITGKGVEEFKAVIPYLKPYDLVDINCGCPSTRTTDNESGSFLLKSPDKIYEMIRVIKKAGFTVTAKIRLGFKNNNVLEVARAIEAAGADALTVHARLAWHSNKVPADWEWIARVKKAAKIPVIGNGDIDSPKKAADMLKIADGVMIARAAIGNPFIFRQTAEYLETGKEIEFDFYENLKYFQKYLVLVQEYGIVDLSRIKFIGSHFLRGVKGVAKRRQELMACKSVEEIEKFVNDVLAIRIVRALSGVGLPTLLCSFRH